MIAKTYKNIKIDRIMLFGDPATANVYYGFTNDVTRIEEHQKEIEKEVKGKKVKETVIEQIPITEEEVENSKDCQIAFTQEELKIVADFQTLILNKIKKQEGI